MTLTIYLPLKALRNSMGVPSQWVALPVIIPRELTVKHRMGAKGGTYYGVNFFPLSWDTIFAIARV
jgi:hypothetical protein